MRRKFTEALKEIVLKDEKIVFLTGDLGFNALEEIREIMGERFINCGVAEQSMVSIAAGLAYKGYKVFCYSIAPFLVFRCLEQIKNDVCLHNLPVFIIGNGGGYGYGIMGSTHHAIEDIAAMSSLPNMQCYIPAFDVDVKNSLEKIIARKKPAYLRLGLAVKCSEKAQACDYNFRRINYNEKSKLTILTIGPIIRNVIAAIVEDSINKSIDLYNFVEFPFIDFPDCFIESLKRSRRLLIIEEHIKRGGVAEDVSLKIHENKIDLSQIISLNCKGYPSGRYGDQNFHLNESGLSTKKIIKTIYSMI
ncbi:MAG: transketolase [Bacteroidota bacterium]